jgi:signal transduction histidine kinase
VTPKPQTEPNPAETVLLDAMGRWRGSVGLVFVFTIVQALLDLLGYALKESTGAPAVMWPSIGFGLVALWLSPRRLWVPLLLAYWAAEIAVATVCADPFVLVWALAGPLANCLNVVLGASLLRWLIKQPTDLRMKQALQFVGASAVGAFAGALFGAWSNTAIFGGGLTVSMYLLQLQTWWAGNWLGSLVVAPVVFCWISPLRQRHRELAVRSRAELALLIGLLAAFSFYVFAAGDKPLDSLLQLPTVIVGLSIYAAVRLPPRWVATLFALTAVICAWLVAMRSGPFQTGDLFFRTVQVQAFLVSLGVLAFALSMSTAERNIAMGQLGEAEHRYRKFVELSAEAVWRVELKPPMPVSLPLEEQLAWLRAYAQVVESSRTYEELDPQAALGVLPWRGDLGWSAAYEQQLAQAAQTGYSIDGVRFTAAVRGKPHAFVTSFSGVVEEGRLLRLWGVARDITDLTDLNARLQREQDRLKTYARQLVTAEEKARRATAVDLHDGIGQSMVGIAMTLDVARKQATPDVVLLVDEARARLREVQEHTRHMISDLSPPGLYDLGLEPALQWLAVYMRGRDRLRVELQMKVREDSIKLDMRVLVFKLVRELLRNVVKHAGVREAHVSVGGDAEQLRVEVSDQGRGFEWQMDMFGAHAGGFGLWSIADRVYDVGGQFIVDTAPGRGSRFSLVLPLGNTLLARGLRQDPPAAMQSA